MSYSALVEDGGIRKEIKPKRAKWLTIPIGDKALVRSKSQIKKSSLDKLFKQVGFVKGTPKIYSKVKGKTVSDIFKETGIVLTKRSKPARVKAQKNLARFAPEIARRLEIGFLRLEIINR